MEKGTCQTAGTQRSSLLQTSPVHDLGDPNSTEAEQTNFTPSIAIALQVINKHGYCKNSALRFSVKGS
jgi:hypothetical protein